MQKIARGFRKAVTVIDKINGPMSLIIIFLMLALTAIMDWEVIMRYVFNSPTMFSGEICQMIQVCLAVLGAGYVLKEGGHVNVELVYVTLNHKWRSYVGIFFSMLGFCYCAVIAWLSWYLVKASFSMDELTFDLGAPVWPIKTIFFVGISIFGLQFLLNSYNYYSSIKTQSEDQ
jgi:C4-dicarboxylate transporter DctQ subunit